MNIKICVDFWLAASDMYAELLVAASTSGAEESIKRYRMIFKGIEYNSLNINYVMCQEMTIVYIIL